MTALLEVSDLVIRYDERVLHRVSLRVDRGETVALLGRNGAGKTTLLRSVFGFLKPEAGDVSFGGQSLVGRRPNDMARLGIAFVPESRAIFHRLSVLENLQLATLRAPREEATRLEEVFALFPLLRERARASAGTLSGGQQQMLALGRALMGSPRLLLLDEPSLGLAPKILDQLFATFAELSRKGLTILLVEQNVKRALSIASRGYLLNLGRVVMEAPAGEILRDERLQTIYLGKSADVFGPSG